MQNTDQNKKIVILQGLQKAQVKLKMQASESIIEAQQKALLELAKIDTDYPTETISSGTIELNDVKFNSKSGMYKIWGCTLTVNSKADKNLINNANNGYGYL